MRLEMQLRAEELTAPCDFRWTVLPVSTSEEFSESFESQPSKGPGKRAGTRGDTAPSASLSGGQGRKVSFGPGCCL